MARKARKAAVKTMRVPASVLNLLMTGGDGATSNTRDVMERGTQADLAYMLKHGGKLDAPYLINSAVFAGFERFRMVVEHFGAVPDEILKHVIENGTARMLRYVLDFVDADTPAKKLAKHAPEMAETAAYHEKLACLQLVMRRFEPHVDLKRTLFMAVSGNAHKTFAYLLDFDEERKAQLDILVFRKAWGSGAAMLKTVLDAYGQKWLMNDMLQIAEERDNAQRSECREVFEAYLKAHLPQGNAA